MSQDSPVDPPPPGPPSRPETETETVGPGRSVWRWFRDGLTPGDVLTGASVLIAAIGLAIAFVSLQGALDAATQQAKAVNEQNAEASRQDLNNAPLLIAATPPSERGAVQTINLNYGQVTKRADRLYIAAASNATPTARIVVTLQNGGNGLAVIFGRPTLVDSCDREPGRLPKQLAGGPAVYVVRSGQADQFGFFEPSRQGVYADGHTAAGAYTFNYEKYGEIHYGPAPRESSSSRKRKRKRRAAPARGPYQPAAQFVYVVVWYSDGARSALRWLCVQYQHADTLDGGTQWAVYDQRSGVEAW